MLKRSFTRQNFDTQNLGGFTIIELLVVIAIIGLVSSIVMVGIQEARVNVRDAQRIQEFGQLKIALELYFDDNDKYPAGETGGKCIKDSADLKPALAPYLATIPEEPLFSGGRTCYIYFSDAEGSGYKIMADLEKNAALEENDGGIYNDRYELFSTEGFAQTALGGSWYYDWVGRDYALKFDGSEDYVNVGKGGSAEPEKYTAEAWVKISEAQPLFEEGQVEEVPKGACLTIGGLEPAVYQADGTDWYLIESNMNLTLDGWHQIVATYDGSKVRIYIDGEMKNAETVGFVNNLNLNAFIGALSDRVDSGSPIHYFKGVIDEVRLYSRALNSIEIEEHYKGIFNNESELVSLWHFDEGPGYSETADSSGNGNTGYLLPSGDGPEWVAN